MHATLLHVTQRNFRSDGILPPHLAQAKQRFTVAATARRKWACSMLFESSTCRRHWKCGLICTGTGTIRHTIPLAPSPSNMSSTCQTRPSRDSTADGVLPRFTRSPPGLISFWLQRTTGRSDIRTSVSNSFIFPTSRKAHLRSRSCAI